MSSPSSHFPCSLLHIAASFSQSRHPHESRQLMSSPAFPFPSLLKDAHLRPPSIILRIHQDLIRKRIRLIRSNGRDMVPLRINQRNNLHSSFLQTAFNLSSISRSFRFTSRTCKRDINHPCFPDCFFVCFCDEPASFSTALFEELDDYLAARAAFGAVLRRGLVGGNV